MQAMPTHEQRPLSALVRGRALSFEKKAAGQQRKTKKAKVREDEGEEGGQDAVGGAEAFLEDDSAQAARLWPWLVARGDLEPLSSVLSRAGVLPRDAPREAALESAVCRVLSLDPNELAPLATIPAWAFAGSGLDGRGTAAAKGTSKRGGGQSGAAAAAAFEAHLRCEPRVTPAG